MLTLSIIKADTGGYVGHSAVHPDMVTVMPAVAEKLRDRWQATDEEAPAIHPVSLQS